MDGQVRKYLGGVPERFTPSGPAADLTGGQALYTSPSAGRLLIADRDGGRVLVLDRDGTFQAQLMRPGQVISVDEVARSGRFAALHDIWWDEEGETLYIVDGDVLLSAPYR